MTIENNALGFKSVEEAVDSNEYLQKAFENVYRYHEIDRELAQGRTNFQLEKFALLETYTIESAYEATLKSRRQMAEGYMSKLIEMQEKAREFEYKWKDKDKTQPITWNIAGPGGGSQKLCWYDLDKMQLEHYLRSSELEIRDRLYQMEHLDRMLAKLTEQNGGKPVTRDQFLEQDHKYWERRFSEQALDEMLSRETGISIGNIHSMRRATAPSLVDDRNQLKEGYVPISKVLESPQGRYEFMNDLQKKVLEGIQEVMDTDLGLISGGEENKVIEGSTEIVEE